MYIKQSVSSYRRLSFSLCSPPLVLLLLNLSHCVYRRWITLHFHSENITGWLWLWWDFLAGVAIFLNVFVWMSFTDQCEIYSSLEVVVWSQRYFLAGGGQGLGVCVCVCVLLPCCLVEVAAESAVWQAEKPAVTQQGIDWIISVSSDSTVAYTDPPLQTHSFSSPWEQCRHDWGKQEFLCQWMSCYGFLCSEFLSVFL